MLVNDVTGEKTWRLSKADFDANLLILKRRYLINYLLFKHFFFTHACDSYCSSINTTKYGLLRKLLSHASMIKVQYNEYMSKRCNPLY